MKKLFLFILAMSFSLSQQAQKPVVVESDADEVINLWNNKTAPHSNEETADEEYTNKKWGHTSQTVLYVYHADAANATGQAVIMCPGGGYQTISSSGFYMGQFFKSIGVTSIVLKYRLPNHGHPEVPLEDVQEALKWVRKNAARLHVDPKKVGVFGTSAGGHLAAYASTFIPDAEKPNFSILVYPVITGTTSFTHQGTYDYLLGTNRTPEQTRKYSLENAVTATTPPAIIFCSDDDRVVPTISSIKYYEALKNFGIKSTLHVYPSGGHGWCGSSKFKYSQQYLDALTDWLKTL